ncbi:MAG: integrase arm-type DNA-binding domain-containing protein [Thermostichales cyanobacterium BF4_bins_65]
MLSDAKVRAAKPREKPYKLFDEKGLYLEVMPNGSKLWRYKFSFQGKETRLSLGPYPEVPLKEAREQHLELRRQLLKGENPSQIRRQQQDPESESFRRIAQEWLALNKSRWVERHYETIVQRLENHIYPVIGSQSVKTLTATTILPIARKLEAAGHNETAHRSLGIVSQVLRFAVATGRAERDPTTDLRGALAPTKRNHFSAVTDPTELGRILRLMDGYGGSVVVRCALRLAPLVFVRPGELRQARWADIDMERGEWRFNASKTGQPHIVPLARQSLDILSEIYPLSGQGTWVFPGRDANRAMSNMAVLSALRALGIPKEVATGHGFRATARTLLEEVLGFRPEVIELQLAHNVRDPLGRAYNRTTHLEARRGMMQAWADYLDSLRGEGL